MKNACLFLLILIANAAFGQLIYEKGYFIDNHDRRTECYIGYNGWLDNPVRFNYKLDKAAVTFEQADAALVKEFGIYGLSRYIRAHVLMDRTSDNINMISNKKNPVFHQELLFLRVLVQGKASLYHYQSRGLERFFYSVSDSTVNQLVYKKYLTATGVGTNNYYRQQLWIDVRCVNTRLREVENLSYEMSDLVKYFTAFNNCEGDTPFEVAPFVKPSVLRFKLTPGIHMASMSISRSYYNSQEAATGYTPGYQLGLESEIILPFGRNKWGLVVEPTYQQFNKTIKDNTVNFNSVEFPIGIRHYVRLSKETSVFLNGFLISAFMFDFKSRITTSWQSSYEPFSGGNMACGAGIDRKKFSMEVRIYTRRNLLAGYNDPVADYGRISCIAGIKLNKSKE